MICYTVEECQSISIKSFKSEFNYLASFTVNNQIILISYSKCNYGGSRKWLVCPKCNRRTGLLYRKPIQALFLCRICHNLTYELIRYRRSRDENFYKLLHVAKKRIP